MAFTRLFVEAAVDTTTGTDSSGCTLIVVFVSQDTAAQGITDSKGNTWTASTAQTGGAGFNTTGKFLYCVNPTVGTGHTFSAAVAYGSIFAFGYTGNAASPFEQFSGQSQVTPGTNSVAGSILPTEDNCLVLAAVGTGDATSGYSVDAYVTIIADIHGATGTNYGGVVGEDIQTTATFDAPTFSWTGTATRYGVMISFKPLVASAGGNYYGQVGYYQ
jgi:hypothetical protein